MTYEAKPIHKNMNSPCEAAEVKKLLPLDKRAMLDISREVAMPVVEMFIVLNTDYMPAPK